MSENKLLLHSYSNEFYEIENHNTKGSKKQRSWKRLLRGHFFISVYFILEFLNALRKSHELIICHTSSEDIADIHVPGIVIVVPSYTQVYLSFSCLHCLSLSLKNGR